MNAVATIQDLVAANLSDNHNVESVRFIDDLLVLVSEVGEITCTLAGDRGLRFQTRNQPAWDVELDRAKSKLRLLCARLAVLCQENGHEFMLYGGEGTICQTVKARWTNTPGKQEFTISVLR